MYSIERFVAIDRTDWAICWLEFLCAWLTLAHGYVRAAINSTRHCLFSDKGVLLRENPGRKPHVGKDSSHEPWMWHVTALRPSSSVDGGSVSRLGLRLATWVPILLSQDGGVDRMSSPLITRNTFIVQDPSLHHLISQPQINSHLKRPLVYSGCTKSR